MAKSTTASSGVSVAVQQIREGIFEGRFPPGSPVWELILAKDLESVRLTFGRPYSGWHAGLVTRTANVGTSVTRLSAKDVRDRVAIRADLEIKSALAASALMTEE